MFFKCWIWYWQFTICCVFCEKMPSKRFCAKCVMQISKASLFSPTIRILRWIVKWCFVRNILLGQVPKKRIWLYQFSESTLLIWCFLPRQFFCIIFKLLVFVSVQLSFFFFFFPLLNVDKFFSLQYIPA